MHHKKNKGESMTIDITDYDRLTSDNQVRLLNILLDTNKKLERIAIALEEKEKESKWNMM